MDRNQFDQLAKTVASRGSRRLMISWLARGAGLVGILGLGRLAAQAQDPDETEDENQKEAERQAEEEAKAQKEAKRQAKHKPGRKAKRKAEEEAPAEEPGRKAKRKAEEEAPISLAVTAEICRNNKTLLCHKDQVGQDSATRCIEDNAVQSHLEHGDCICGNTDCDCPGTVEGDPCTIL